MRVRQLFLVRTATLNASPPPGGWHATQLPPNSVWSLVQVEEWNGDDQARDAWEGLVDVVEIRLGMLDQTIPPQIATLLATWGVSSTDTVRAALQKVRAQWPGARHY